ncbi:Uncharacterised protein [Staphylococcus gallinarum]|uniref:Uncharacterized protein n=1 Tax=Staphylococcus gallinarum TaxID=1293 RepID=A0A380FME9_STAGA|nr:Uncharacterised protein [Staphylococcus gallinarum]
MMQVGSVFLQLFLIAFSVLINITFDIVQINSVAISLNIIELISTILLIYVTLLPSKSTSDEALKWL